MKKIRYSIYSEGVKTTVNHIKYDYGRTKNIELTITESGFCITAYQTVRKAPDKLLEDGLFKDGIKKAVLIQLIKYGFVCYKKVFCKIEEEVSLLFDDENSSRKLIYEMCGEKLIRKISQEWNERAIQRIASRPKSRTTRIDASLYAFLVSKSKLFETERFVYLWMTINGIYSYVSDIASTYVNSKKEKAWLGKEYGQLKFYSMLNNYPYRTVTENEDEFRFRLELLLTQIMPDDIDEFIQALKDDNQSNPYVVGIHEILIKFGIEKTMHPYALILIRLPYMIRCKYFHSEKAIPLLCFENEHPIPLLRVLNRVLETFLDDELPKWFDTDYLEKYTIPEIIELARNCRCDNNHLQSCLINGIDRK